MSQGGKTCQSGNLCGAEEACSSGCSSTSGAASAAASGALTAAIEAHSSAPQTCLIGSSGLLHPRRKKMGPSCATVLTECPSDCQTGATCASYDHSSLAHSSQTGIAESTCASCTTPQTCHIPTTGASGVTCDTISADHRIGASGATGCRTATVSENQP